jgi:hypothetical protein
MQPLPGYKHEVKRAFELYEQYATDPKRAEDNDDADALALVAECLLAGSRLGTPKNAARALELYKRSAAKGHPLAIYHLAFFFSEGEIVAYNPQKYLRFLTLSADLGYDEARVALARELLLSESSRAVSLLKQAAHDHHADAAYELGKHYRSGSGRDWNVALSWFQKAESYGHPMASRVIAALKVKIAERNAAALATADE